MHRLTNLIIILMVSTKPVKTTNTKAKTLYNKIYIINNEERYAPSTTTEINVVPAMICNNCIC